jgi:iron donor protein CyaY
MPPLPLIDTCASTALFSVHAGLPEAARAARPFLASGKLLMYAEFMLDEKDFQRKADATFEDLKRRMLTAGDEHGFDVEGEAGKLEVLFEEPEEAKFVISPNTPVREIWVSALSTSFKLGWNASRNAFVHEKTGEDLRAVMSRVISEQLGAQVTL